MEIPKVEILSVCLIDDCLDASKEKIGKLKNDVNDFLAKYPNASITWLQSQNGDYRESRHTRLTAIITY